MDLKNDHGLMNQVRARDKLYIGLIERAFNGVLVLKSEVAGNVLIAVPIFILVNPNKIS